MIVDEYDEHAKLYATICVFCDFEFETDDVMTPRCYEHQAAICPACYTCQAHPVSDERKQIARDRRERMGMIGRLRWRE
jgi:hypothetical protein